MELIVGLPHFELYADRHEASDGTVSLSIYSVWPQARTDKSPHRLLQLNLPDDAMEDLGRFILRGE